ncbi:NAD(P)H-dependent oxidoreductase [Parapedobacter deserti]|uniref:NAD(P)H-dependent oxidoreductase n=1 Tax=Parapedobacter deserti TaxID=1912957 RepID=A0ABV7JHU3_9SPHI
MKKILLFAGSNSAQSINRKIVEQAAGMLNGYKASLIDLRDFPLPLFSVDTEEQEGVPESAHKLRELFHEHDGFVVSIAEHNASVTTAFKNTMDWLSRTQEDYRILLGKQVWLLSTSPAESGGGQRPGGCQSDLFHTGSGGGWCHRYRQLLWYQPRRYSATG